MKGVEAAAVRVLDRLEGKPIDDRGYLAWA
jgi:hypothetical protein